jgi:hypothetical protein|uniref:PorV/PorQ family protein n=1 Tax=candidate division WOR-3 bacterium TaxID=2052148 RepID=A0A7V3PTS9_UNCW3
MKIFKPAIISLLLFTLISPVTAGERKLGAAWLKIPVGARDAAMAGTGTAAAFGPQGLVYNPAATARLAPFTLQAGYTRWLLDTHHQSIFVSRDLHYFQLGLGLASFAYGKLEYRENRPTAEPIGTFSPLDLTAYLNFSRQFGKLTELGITARYYYSKVLDYEISAPGLDIGARFHPLPNLTIGAAITDFSRTLYYYYEQFWLPTRSRIGVAYQLPLSKNRLTVAIDGSYFFYNQEFRFTTGIEWTLAEIFSLRAGYDPLNPGNRLNFGAGFHHGLFRVDYAYSPLGFALGSAHRFGISFGY